MFFDISNAIEVDDEIHIWLNKSTAQDVARHFINNNVIFSYLPVPGNENEVEITFGTWEEIGNALKFSIEVRK